jgi:hypothetical protein
VISLVDHFPDRRRETGVLRKMANMKILFLSMAVCVVAATSCGDRSSAASANAAVGAGSPGDDHGPGTFTYTIEGTKYALQVHPEAGPHPTLLYINKAETDSTGTVQVEITSTVNSDLFKFRVAAKGTTNVLHYRPSFESKDMSAEYLRYKTGTVFYADSVTVTITAADAGHIAGSFSGTFVAEKKPNVAGGGVMVTEGAFDLPITKDKIGG